MIKATGVMDGKPLVILGLSEHNIRHATQDRPIKVNLSELGLPPITVLIVVGETEEQIYADLQQTFNEAPLIDKKTPRDNRTHG